MTREDMITALIEDRLNDWVFASNTDTLEDALEYGFKGFAEYTDEELKEIIEDFELDVEELLVGRERRVKKEKESVPFGKR